MLVYACTLKGVLQMKAGNRRDLFPGALEMMILRILRSRPVHGYALSQEIKTASHQRLLVEEGSLYPALQRMLKEGLVKAEWGISSTNRRGRIYKIKAAGRKQIEREIASFEHMIEGVRCVLSPVRP